MRRAGAVDSVGSAGTAELRTSEAVPELAGLRRPRWRDDVPALWRNQSSVQFGEAVIVDRLSPAHLTWLSGLDGLRTSAEIVDGLPLPVAEIRRLLRALIAAGGLEDAACIPNALRWIAQSERDVAARRFSAALHTYRDLDAAFNAIDSRERLSIAVLGDTDLRELLTGALAAGGLAVSDGGAALAVLADSHHPDVPAHFDHELQDLPHVHVGIFGARATVGPLVVPGITSCLRCANLHRRDADPAWPLLAVQWAQVVPTMTNPPIDPLLARIAADHAALLVRTWIDRPDRPELWANLALEITLPVGTVERVARPPHPLCGCRWPWK